jgi:serine/threonine-protein kinase
MQTTANPLRPGARTSAYTSPSAPLGSGSDYKLGRRLDRGGPDEVYEAFHASQPGRLAIKLARRALTAPPQSTEAFRREVALVARLRHPHVVQVVEMGRLAIGVPFVVMEYLPGQTLRANLARRGPIPAVEVVSWLKALAGALAAAHGTGAVHGGLRPSKVFLMEASGYDRGFVKILDFGAWHLGMGSGRGPDAEVAAYAAPELAMMGVGRPEVMDPAVDQFSLGAIAYRLLAGRDVVAASPRPLSSILPCDPMVESVVMRALSRHPRDRWEGVQAFAGAFEQAALSALPVLTQTVSRNQVVASATLEAESMPPTPLPVVAAPQQPADSRPQGAEVAAELTDDLSQKFFAEGDAAQAGGPPLRSHIFHIRPTGLEATIPVSAASVKTGTRMRAYRQADEDQDLQISLDKLERVPRRRWPGRLLVLALLAGGAVAFWRSELPQAAQVRTWVGERVPLPDVLKR